MADNKSNEPKDLTAAEAAKLVFRAVPKVVDGKPLVDKEGKVVMAKQAIEAEEVLSFKNYGTHVVVVTVDGQKFSSAK